MSYPVGVLGSLHNQGAGHSVNSRQSYRQGAGSRGGWPRVPGAWQREAGGGISESHTVQSQGMRSGMSHWRCGNSGNADVPKETGCTDAALLVPCRLRF